MKLRTRLAQKGRRAAVTPGTVNLPVARASTTTSARSPSETGTASPSTSHVTSVPSDTSPVRPGPRRHTTGVLVTLVPVPV